MGWSRLRTVDRPCFLTILSGEQKIETRYIYPSNAKRYVTQMESTNDNGEPCVVVTPVQYDALYLINGRRKNAPRLLVEVVDEEFVIETDEDGNDLTFMENGEEYLVCQVWYHLGAVLETENLENLDRNYYNEHLNK